MRYPGDLSLLLYWKAGLFFFFLFLKHPRDLLRSCAWLIALDLSFCFSLSGGGFHHCSSDKGGGFCAYADITLAIKVQHSKE